MDVGHRRERNRPRRFDRRAVDVTANLRTGVGTDVVQHDGHARRDSDRCTRAGSHSDGNRNSAGHADHVTVVRGRQRDASR